jgi:hypothetical protein
VSTRWASLTPSSPRSRDPASLAPPEPPRARRHTSASPETLRRVADPDGSTWLPRCQLHPSSASCPSPATSMPRSQPGAAGVLVPPPLTLSEEDSTPCGPGLASGGRIEVATCQDAPTWWSYHSGRPVDVAGSATSGRRQVLAVDPRLLSGSRGF